MTGHKTTAPATLALPRIRTVCVLGGAGFVGQHVVHLLQAGGYGVRVPTRRRERCKDLIVLPGVDVVEADIHDPGALKDLLQGMDAAINLVGILHERRTGRVDKPAARRGDFHEIHVELPRKIVHACAQNGVRRLLHMSALNADATARSAYLRSKGAGEALVLEAALPHSENERWYLDGPKFVKGQGMAVTVFRPSVIFGERDSFLNLFARLVRLFPLIPLASPYARFQPIFVEDVARAFVASLDNPTTYGQAYDLCGPKVYTLRELVEYAAAIQGLRRRVLPLSQRLSYLQAWALEHLPGRLMTRDNYWSMQVDSVCGCDFPAVFGFRPTPLEVVAPRYLAPRAVHSRYDDYRVSARR